MRLISFLLRKLAPQPEANKPPIHPISERITPTSPLTDTHPHLAYPFYLLGRPPRW